MPPRHGSRQIATPPVERTQYTTSSEPDDEEDSTSDPRQASGNYYESEQSPEVTREPSGGRTLSGIDEEIGTLWKLLLELGLQGFDYENLRQRAECITRLQELEREFSNLITPSQADLASPQPPVENPENSETNLNEHSYDRSAQEEVSAPAPDDTPITSIQGEDPKDPRDKIIPIQGMVFCTENPNTTPITTNFTTVPKTTVTNQPVQTQDRSGKYQPAETDNKPVKATNEPAKRVLTTSKLLGSTAKGGNIRSIMTKGYAYSMHARRPHVLALQGIG
jgi:hypothetical protein